ncbi:PGF-CTERM sorting domain-containing protein [Halorussus sp. MSC15.2]|nr:PGF-CTERM sorting domain-containing protein [Halorussus sp. MSC15.2]
MSVFAGTIAFAGAASAAAGNVEKGDAFDLNPGQRYWAGQTVFTDEANSTETTVEIIDETDGSLADSFVTDSEGDIKFSTKGLEGNYYLQNENGQNLTDANNKVLSFKVTSQDLSASFEDDVDNKHSTKTELNLNSKRTNYDATITSSGLSSEELEGIFTDITTKRTENGVAIQTIQTETINTSFKDVDAGNYTFKVEVNDTGAVAEADINVSAGGDAMATFQGSGVVSEERGDIASFTIDLENSDKANVSIGSQDVNWKANFTVYDNGTDNEVTVNFNTYKSDSGVVKDFVSVEGDDAVKTHGTASNGGSIQGVHTNWDNNQTADPGGLGSPISAGQYEMITGVNGEDDVTQLSLNEGSIDGAQVWKHPRKTSNLPSDVSDLVSNVVKGDSVAMQDLAVVEFTASGLYGNDSLTHHNLSTNFNASDVYSLNVTQTNPGANAQPNEFEGNQTREVYFDSANNTVYAVVDTSSNDISVADKYRATFTVHQGSSVTDEARSANTTFTVTERELSFTGVNESDVLPVAGNISGDTSIAAGSEFQVQVKSDSFVRTATATVQDDGTFVAPFDFSDVDTGTDVTVSAKSGDASDEVDGVIVESAETTTTTTSNSTTTTTTETTTTTTTTADTTTTTEETTTEETTTTEQSGSIPGFGVAVSMVALVAAALLALRRSN